MAGILNKLTTASVYIEWVRSSSMTKPHTNVYTDPADGAEYDVKSLDADDKGHEYRLKQRNLETIEVFTPYRVLDAETAVALRGLRSYLPLAPFAAPTMGLPGKVGYIAAGWQKFSLHPADFKQFEEYGKKHGWTFKWGFADLQTIEKSFNIIKHNTNDFLMQMRLLRALTLPGADLSESLTTVMTRVDCLRSDEQLPLLNKIKEFTDLIAELDKELTPTERFAVGGLIREFGELSNAVMQVNWQQLIVGISAAYAGRAIVSPTIYVELGRELAALARIYPVLNVLSVDGASGALRIRLGAVTATYDGKQTTLDGDLSTLLSTLGGNSNRSTGKRLAAIQTVEDDPT